ncbi:ABC transporter permease subunit [Acuticoccus sp. MNP-M23]|uniref:amino acid ABC transporter permease n=1 Tax=Acuticoccus sp. MNP-M23 TaxID=3072793 RepID=UPI002814E0F4|nr:ABC transporter permease subunit [Acuticoccus sp. MNP-M23]WMS44317.1 ABC transporter permease subunit [Acuticoccus sp. MNP-M23]
MKRFIHDRRVRSFVFQGLLVGTLVLVLALAALNARQALGERGLSSGFGFLSEKAGFAVSESVIPFGPDNTVGRAFVAGLSNTISVSLAAIVLATLVGVVVGIARLSPNKLVARAAGVYVESFRNTPQLIQIIFWYALVISLPAIRQAFALGGGVFVSNRGLVMPWLDEPLAAGLAAAGLGAGFVAALVLVCLPGRRRWRGKAVAALLLVPVAGAVAAAAMVGLSVPELKGFNFRGGATISPEFLALFLGLGLYIAAFIAEIVRAGLAGVDKGQVEAARALGLSERTVLFSVRIPQALRIIVPPATAQYISLVKNSSLGVAIGYPELFNVSNSLATLTGQAIECVGIMALLYLATALGMSALANGFNRMTLITER